MILDSIIRMNYAKQHLDNLSLLNLHLNVDDITTFPDWNNVKLLDINMQRVRTNYPVATDNSHPGAKAHNALAKLLYKHIKSLD